MTCTPSQYVTIGNDTLCPITNGNQVIELLGFTRNGASTIAGNLGVLVGLYAVMMTLSYFALKRTSRKRD
jgi:hypothetical protein